MTRLVATRLAMLFALLFALVHGTSADAAPLRVGTKHAPPFAQRGADGRWHGISIALWEDLADDLDLEYEYVERDLPGLLTGLEDGSLDVVAAALTVTAQREAKLDFTAPFHTTGLAVVVRDESTPVWLQAVRLLVSTSFVSLILVVGLLQLAVGTLVWALEKRANPDQFGQHSLWRGLAAGFWWSTVTMTTVGYGDKTPRTMAGRVVAQAWMLCSVVIVSVFTATVASNLTVEQLSSRVRSASDLRNVKVAVVEGSTSDLYAEAHDIDAIRQQGLESAFTALRDGDVDAVVHDAPLLTEELRSPATVSLRLLDFRFRRQDYAFAVPTGSPIRESINRALPERLRRSELGDSGARL
ncbi:MAG: transporter substrate-binding domain-containing protein [Nannocystales bacterium]